MKPYKAIYSIEKEAFFTDADVLFAFNAIEISYEDHNGILHRINVLDKSIESWENEDSHTVVIWGSYSKKLVIEGVHSRREIEPKIIQNKTTSTDANSILIPFWLKIAAGLVLFGVVFYFWGLDVVVDQTAGLMPASFEKAFGNSIVKANYYESQKIKKQSELITSYLQSIRLPNDRGYEKHVYVIDEPVFNAFAIPGGHIVIYSMLLDSLKKPEELTALLGHEWTHVERQHSTKLFLKTYGIYFIVSQLIGSSTGLLAAILKSGEQLGDLSYSREYEAEADERSVSILQRNKTDPRGIVWLLDQIDRQEVNSLFPEILKTHPDTKNRIAMAKAILQHHPIEPVVTPLQLQKLFLELKKKESPSK